jgi:hypothetical protein
MRYVTDRHTHDQLGAQLIHREERELVADANAIYPHIEESPWIVDVRLRKLAEFDGIPPDRVDAALTFLMESARAVQLRWEPVSRLQTLRGVRRWLSLPDAARFLDWNPPILDVVRRGPLVIDDSSRTHDWPDVLYEQIERNPGISVDELHSWGMATITMTGEVTRGRLEGLLALLAETGRVMPLDDEDAKALHFRSGG